MNSKPLSISSRAIVPFGIPKPSVPTPEGSFSSSELSQFASRHGGHRHGLRRRLGRGLWFGRSGRRIGRPEMAAAFWTNPELVRRPRHARPGVAHVHLRAAALTSEMAFDIRHGGILTL